MMRLTIEWEYNTECGENSHADQDKGSIVLEKEEIELSDITNAIHNAWQAGKLRYNPGCYRVVSANMVPC